MARITNAVIVERIDNLKEYITNRFNSGEKKFDKINGSVQDHEKRLMAIELENKKPFSRGFGGAIMKLLGKL